MLLRDRKLNYRRLKDVCKGLKRDRRTSENARAPQPWRPFAAFSAGPPPPSSFQSGCFPGGGARGGHRGPGRRFITRRRVNVRVAAGLLAPRAVPARLLPFPSPPFSSPAVLLKLHGVLVLDYQFSYTISSYFSEVFLYNCSKPLSQTINNYLDLTINNSRVFVNCHCILYVFFVHRSIFHLLGYILK